MTDSFGYTLYIRARPPSHSISRGQTLSFIKIGKFADADTIRRRRRSFRQSRRLNSAFRKRARIFFPHFPALYSPTSAEFVCIAVITFSIFLVTWLSFFHSTMHISRPVCQRRETESESLYRKGIYIRQFAYSFKK